MDVKRNTLKSTFEIRQLAPGDAGRLAEFYNGLSQRSRTTFRPLGWSTSVAACADIVGAQAIAGPDQSAPGSKYDLVAWRDDRIAGWSFVWNLHSEEPFFGLGVADAYQGQGLGSALMDRVLAAVQGLGIRHLELTVVQDNHVAWQMYGRRGFARYGEFLDEKDGLAYFRMRKMF
jgi:ribosomal protein S18 acetylase RimI-like enzyme